MASKATNKVTKDIIRYPEIHLWQARDGYRFAVRKWSVANPRAEVVFLHGIVSHGGWYLASCSFLAQRGYQIHFLERRGSGLNLAGRGDVPSYRTWLEDVVDYLERIPGRPRVLLGISWGAKLAAAVAGEFPNTCEAVGFIGPGLFAFQQAGLGKQALLRILRKVGLGRIRVTIPLQDPHLFTDNPDWLWYLASDPLTLRKVTIQFATEDLKLNSLARRNPEAIRQPALLILAGQDRICDNQRTKQYFNRIGGAKHLVEFPSCHHTLEFEPDPLPYFQALVHWLEEITSSYTKSFRQERRCLSIEP